jgi:O-antigen/teichoic acid export membrane protein
MSLQRNIVANYAGQLYVTLAGIVLLPVYVRLMGTEAFGLVGFFTMLQSWFLLLDMGLTPTMARETARFAGGATDALFVRRLLRCLEIVFAIVAAIGASLLVAGADFVARHWLTVDLLPIDEVRRSLRLMGCIVAVRWMAGLYRGAITGFERIVWLNKVGVGLATARFALVIPFLSFVSNSATAFFAYQLVIAATEATLLALKAYSLLPRSDADVGLSFDWTPLRGVLRFSVTLAFTSSAWILITQTDKLVLSGALPLGAYAHFTLAVVVASGIMQISGPVSAALLPRLTRLLSEGDGAAVARVYGLATQAVAVLAVPAITILVVFPQQVLWAWTGDAVIAESSATILRLYAAGNGCMVFAAFGYYLQYAHGNLRLHFIANVTFILVYVPVLLWAVLRYGAVGAGYAWLIANLLPLIVWLPIVHRRFLTSSYLSWILRDVGGVAWPAVLVALAIKPLLHWPTGRVGVAVVALGAVAICLGAAVAGSRVARAEVWRRLPHGG